MEELLGQHVDLGKVNKIGEGTFGEAFKAGNVVLKIVPMDGMLMVTKAASSACILFCSLSSQTPFWRGLPWQSLTPACLCSQVNGEVQKGAGEILAEVAVTLTLSALRGSSHSVQAESSTEFLPVSQENLTAGFVETFGVGICRGSYAPALCEAWRHWDRRFSSENDPVDVFPADQVFAVGGRAKESSLSSQCCFTCFKMWRRWPAGFRRRRRWRGLGAFLSTLFC